MPPIGRLDRPITVRRATVTYNEFNEPIETWSDLVTVWAKRTDASAAESYRAQEVGAQISARFTVRYPDLAHLNVNPKDRIAFEGREYDITGIREPENTRDRWSEIDAVARADG